MTPKLDIQNYDKRYKRVIGKIKESSISERNKNLIENFERNCFIVEALSKPRRIKLMDTLFILARDYLKKDFDKIKAYELKDAVKTIEEREDYSVWTKQNYRVILKKFYKWLEYGDGYGNRRGYPEIVEWINTNIKKKDKPKVKASDILTEKEVNALINATGYPRDKAFIVMLYELGARISEIGNLKIKDVSRDEYSYIIDLSGKTGHRTPRIVISDPYLTIWLNEHPLREYPDSPLWVTIGDRKNGIMNYEALRKILLRIKGKARIKKRLYPHLFRHSRVTHLLKNKQINESQAKIYFGWVPDSKVLAEYSHLLSSDVNDTILEIHGIKKSKVEENELQPKQCPRCKKINMKDALFCQQCSSPLDVKTAMGLDDEKGKWERRMAFIARNPEKRKALGEWFEEADRKELQNNSQSFNYM